MKKKDKFKVILDTDVARVDDSFALCYALSSNDKIDVLAVTLAPYKNKQKDISIEEHQLDGKFEVGRILSFMGKSVRDMVFAGAINYFSSDNQTNPAVERIKEIADAEEEVTILCAGTLTNIAILLKIYPYIISKIRLIWVGTGNLLLDKFEDFNYANDKKAFEEVVKSGVDISVIPDYVAKQFVTDIYELEHDITKSQIGKYLVNVLKNREERLNDKVLTDIASVVYLLNHEKFTEKQINANELLKEQEKIDREVLINYVFDVKSSVEIWKEIIENIDSVEYTSKQPDVFFISDTHFTQKSKILRNQVPFKTMEECDRELISRWNNVVSKDDKVYHLGDFGNYEKIKELNGKVTLICGNYEKLDYGENFDEFRKNLMLLGFYDVIKQGIYLEKDEFGEKVYLTHEPSDHAKDCLTLFGHVHDLAPVKPFGFNVCVTYHDFTPISRKEAKRLLLFVKNYSKDKNLFS